MPKYGNFENGPVSWKPLPIEQKEAQFGPSGVEWAYMCNFWNFSQKFHAQIWQFWKLGSILETPAHRAKISSIWTLWRRMSIHVQLLELWPLAMFHAQIWEVRKLARILETAARRAKKAQFWLPGVERDYMCNLRTYGHLLSFMPQYGNFEIRAVSWKQLHIEREWAQFRLHGVERGLYVQLLELCPLARFHAQIWQFWKLARISEPLPIERK